MSGCKPRLLLPGDFVSLNYLLELQGSKGATPRQGRGAGGLFVGSVIQPAAGSTASLGRRMPKQCRGSQSERELGEATLLPQLLKRGCKAWGGHAGLCPPAQGGVFGRRALLAAPPAAGATVTSGASPCPAVEDSPAAMRLLARRSRRCPPRFGPSASGGGGVRLGRCCRGGTAGLGTGMGLPAAASVCACMSVRVCARVSTHRCTCISMSPCIRGHA